MNTTWMSTPWTKAQRQAIAEIVNAAIDTNLYTDQVYGLCKYPEYPGLIFAVWYVDGERHQFWFDELWMREQMDKQRNAIAVYEAAESMGVTAKLEGGAFTVFSKSGNYAGTVGLSEQGWWFAYNGKPVVANSCKDAIAGVFVCQGLVAA